MILTVKQNNMEKYISTLTLEDKPKPHEQEQVQFSSDEMIRRVQCGNIIGHTRLLEAQMFLNGLGEIRMALNLPSVSDKDAGLGERQPLQPMFDSDGVEELRGQYLKLLRSFIKYSDVQLAALTEVKSKE